MKKILLDLRYNFKNGLILLLLKEVPLTQFIVSYQQLWTLILLFLSTLILSGLIQNMPEVVFNSYGIIACILHLFFIALYVLLVARNTDKMFHLFIALLCLWILSNFFWTLISNHLFLSFWQSQALEEEINIKYFIFNLWIGTAVIITTIRAKLENSPKNIQIIMLYVIYLATPLNYLNFNSFWYEKQKPIEETISKYDVINQEDIYYQQFNLINSAKQQLLMQRQGILDIYFVGFASYANQDVFMKEVNYAQELFDNKFDTKNRSITLINNIKTYQNKPLATQHNLNNILEYIGALMDSEDFLFLYLTSHGSKDHQLSVDMGYLNLNKITPKMLMEALDKAQIKNRILVISACYSGGFIEPLKNNHSLIFTAAAHDKTSFGCSQQSDFTYFGEAIFKDQLNYNYDFIDAFKQAIIIIKKREIKEQKEPSNPQLYIGSQIKDKLIELGHAIEQWNKIK